jgi:hypothetical protein
MTDIDPFIDTSLPARVTNLENALGTHVADAYATRFPHTFEDTIFTYDVVVAPNDDLTTQYHRVIDAVNDGFSSIFVRNGTYIENTVIDVNNSGVKITGETRDGVIIQKTTDADKELFNLDGTDFGISNLTIEAYYDGTNNTDMILFDVNASRLTVKGLTVKYIGTLTQDSNVDDTALFTGTALATGHNISDVVLDYSGMTITDTNINPGLRTSFFELDNSKISNITATFTGITIGGSIDVLSYPLSDDCDNTLFENISIIADTENVEVEMLSPDVAPRSRVQYELLFIKAMRVSMSGTFTASTFVNNGVNPFTYDGTVFPSGQSHCFVTSSSDENNINGCTFVTDDTFLQFLANGDRDVVTNNRFYGGSNCNILRPTTIFSNNFWKTGYNAAAADLGVGASGDNSNLIGNIIEGNGTTPTITINGGASGVNNQYNQLIA